MALDPPAKLPVPYLSVSSINLLEQCPTKWKFRYIDQLYEPPHGPMILGSAAWAAEGRHYATVVATGEGFSLEQVEDEYSAEWDDRVEREEADWGDEKPGQVKDRGRKMVDAYHTKIAPHVMPISVEREVKLRWHGLDWHFIGYLDLEEDDGAVTDAKFRKKGITKPEADKDLQPASYLLARRAEGNPASEFRYHSVANSGKPRSRTMAGVVQTTRTNVQLDTFEHRIFAAAQEIAWRMENDFWTPAPAGAWWCDPRFCGYYGRQCPWTRRS